MRLLRLEEDGEFSLADHVSRNIPQYAILSHTWGADHEEVTFKDIMNGTGKSKVGYAKIRFCAKQAAEDGLQYFWVDTCCIDKSSSAELSEAINCMFRWYKDAARCYVYLSDVSASGSVGDESSRRWKPGFNESRWFTRGWTLQELIAPKSVQFFSEEGQLLGDKQSLEQTLYEITGIAIQALQGSHMLHFSVNERMSWAAKRETKREEDEAYSLLGIFDIHMPLIYGEGRKKAMSRLLKEIKETSKVDPSLLNEEQKWMLLDSLRFDQIDVREMTIKNAYSNTCKWLLNTPQYLDWLDATKLGEHHGILWIKGKGGVGKSTLMKFALTNTRKMMKDRIVISFFFNARGEGIEKSTIGLYRSLLLQLLKQLPALQVVFDSLNLSMSNFRTHHQWSVELLKTLLEKVMQNLEESSVVCFIDALNECEQNEIQDMVSFFEHINEFAISPSTRFRLCLSSRHYPNIKIKKHLALALEQQKGHDQDIMNYIDSELKIGRSMLAKRIRTDIRGRASGKFKRVIRIVHILNREYDGENMHTLQQRLLEIPNNDLHKIFCGILARDPNNIDRLVLCIQWVLFSRCSLSPEQLYFAIISGVEPDRLLKWDPEGIRRDMIEAFILSSSKGIVQITTSNIWRVQFINKTAQNFFQEENGLGSIWPDLGSNFQGQSHERLKNCCLNYLNVNLSAYLEFYKSLPKASLQETATHRKLASNAFPFLKYAIRNILYHADVAAGCGIAQENFIQSFPLNHWIQLNNLFEEQEICKHTGNASLLYILAERNMSNLIRAHPSIFSCLELENERYGPPLFAALATGSKEAVRTFVEVYAATQSPDTWLYKTGGQYNHKKDSWGKFGRDFKFSNRRTILSYLAELGDEVIFTLALHTGNIMPNSKDRSGRTPLWYAVINGHEAVVKLLLDTGKIDVNSKDTSGRTPLWWAVLNRHEAVVKLLLETGNIDVDSKDMSARTPLWWAVLNKQEAVVDLLLKTGQADVNSKDSDGRTMLSRAAEKGHEGVVSLLLETGKADVDSRDTSGRAPLCYAVINGHEAIVKLLLETGNVDVDSKDTSGWTPLWHAAINANEAIVKLLLETCNVDVDSKDTEGGTLL